MASVQLLADEIVKASKLPAEKQTLAFWQLLASHHRHLAVLDPAVLGAQASVVLDDLIAATSHTVFQRAHRTLLARCFIAVLSKYDKSPFEVTNKLLTILSKERDDRIRITLLCILEAIFSSMGHDIVSLQAEGIVVLIKIIKPSSAPINLRVAALKTLEAVINMGKLTENLERDLLKLIRPLITDRATVVGVASRYVLNAIILYSTVTTEEVFRTTLLKSILSLLPQQARTATSVCLASLLVKKFNAPMPDDSVSSMVQAGVASLSNTYARSQGRTTSSVIVGVYLDLFKRMGRTWINVHYKVIMHSVLNDLLLGLAMEEKHKILTARKHVRILLKALRKSLDQEHQLEAINSIVELLRAAPSKHVIVPALAEMAALIGSLGSLTPPDLELDPVYFLATHSVHSVQVATAALLRDVALNVPTLLPTMLTMFTTRLQDELKLVADPANPAQNRDTVGYALTVSAILRAGVERPLYVEIDKFASTLFQLATDTLKNSARSNLQTSAIQVQVAWALIGALQTLGPNFVRSHLAQLLLLWRNALPRPVAKEARKVSEHPFLLHVRDCTLGSIYAFLCNCRVLCTADVLKRLSSMVSASLAYLRIVEEQVSAADMQSEQIFSMSIADLHHLVKRRVWMCAGKLLTMGAPLADEDLVPTALRTFANPAEGDAAHVLGYVSIWSSADNYAYGLAPGELQSHFDAIDKLFDTPICSGIEHDYLHLYVEGEADESMPASTASANLAIGLFGKTFHKQAPAVQESLLARMGSFINAQQNSRNPGRRMAVLFNCVSALKAALEPEEASFIQPRVLQAMNDILIESLSSSDSTLRNTAAAAMGRLASFGGQANATLKVNEVIDRIVNDRESTVRAGCVTALGQIYRRLGGIAAVYHLRAVLNVLLSLAADPHPVVHFYTLEALVVVVEASGLNYSAHVNDTLTLLLQLYVTDVLDPDTGTLASSNMAIDFDCLHLVAQNADSLINIIGPDLEDDNSARDQLLTLVNELVVTTSNRLIADGLICTQHLALYAAKKLDLTTYIVSLHYHLRNADPLIQEATADGLYELMKVNANAVVRHSSVTSRFDTALWLLLDSRPDWNTIKDIIRAWLDQTRREHQYWIELFQQILVRQRLSEVTKDGVRKPTLVEASVEDEGSSFGNADGGDGTKAESLCWQTRLFALQCLHSLVLAVPSATLGTRVADLVRMAFSASTSKVRELQLEGLRFLRSIIVHFKDLRDPDFPEVALLEQYQAQLGSALTPAFAPECHPEVAALGVHVCAEFTASGIVEEVSRMGRILKLLTAALDQFRLQDDGPRPAQAENARAMLKIAVLSAWAELQISSRRQDYLVHVVAPYVSELTPMWLEALKQYASIKFEPTTSGNSMEVQYNALSRVVMVGFYDTAWLKFVHAIATLIEQDKDVVFDALEGHGHRSQAEDINYRDEPAAFFMVLFGICFEALTKASLESDTANNAEVLAAMKHFMKPSICGSVVYTEPIFTEIGDLLGRLLLTEKPASQIIIVDIATSLAQHHPLATNDEGETSHEKLQEFVDQLFDLARLTLLPLTIAFSWDRSDAVAKTVHVGPDLPPLARVCLTNFVRMAEQFPSMIRLDLYNSLLHVFANLFTSAATHHALISATLPAFKHLVDNIAAFLHKDESEAGMLLGPIRYLIESLQAIGPTGAEAIENKILAITILFTALGGYLSSNDALFQDVSGLLLDSLGSKQSASASRAIRSLLTAKDRLPQLCKYILSGLAKLCLKRESHTQFMALQLLADFADMATGAALSSMLSLILPLAIVYQRSKSKDANEKQILRGRVLSLVQRDAASSRQLISSLQPNDKAALETFLKDEGDGVVQSNGGGIKAPQIDLSKGLADYEA
ncbi:armadillo-type protein [Protomyces lactucae-debilis]|uniref:Armadillo-type protein n=1 Tax=Protomyces lactucae-debilis TaxID=2754530 RepID=A0A1Y2FN65_PROLT|nr:armadillo-type protein [Protomyces lactucae-debilis]ORY85450.1 armadillo-type protein [Protomyces lactucae-debilis]